MPHNLLKRLLVFKAEKELVSKTEVEKLSKLIESVAVLAFKRFYVQITLQIQLLF